MDKPNQPAHDKKPNTLPAKSKAVGGLFGVLGKDLSSKYNSRGPKSIRPTKWGGRNGNGKPT